jgi:hypothetical protein
MLYGLVTEKASYNKVPDFFLVFQQQSRPDMSFVRLFRDNISVSGKLTNSFPVYIKHFKIEIKSFITANK